jgi:hypothetical protein
MEDEMADIEQEIHDKVRALAFDNRGLTSEVERLRRFIDRAYFTIPTGVNVPLTDTEQEILQVLTQARTWETADA